MKRRIFLSYCGFLAAAGLLAACGQSSGIVTAPVTESESVGASVPDAVSAAKSTMDYPYLDATEAVRQLFDSYTDSEEDALRAALLQLQEDYPGICYLTGDFLPSADCPAEASVATPDAAALSAQQAANVANQIVRVVAAESSQCTATTLCACPSSDDPIQQEWRIYYEPSAESSVWLALDAITGALHHFINGTINVSLIESEESAMSVLLPQVTDNVAAMLAAANAGQSLDDLQLASVEAHGIFGGQYIATIDGEPYTIQITQDGSVFSFARKVDAEASLGAETSLDAELSLVEEQTS